MSEGGLLHRGCSSLSKRGVRLTLLCAIVGLLSACASGGRDERGIGSDRQATRSSTGKAAPAAPYKVGDPYQINGVWYYPQVDPHYDNVGTASWYGDPFHGRYTANGELYDMNALTAAHTTLPLPTHVEVTNLENGRVLVLRVNDRGPFINGRVIDVSRRAAQLLGFDRKGTATVRVRAVPELGDTMLASAESSPAVQAQAVVAAMPSGNAVPLASSGSRSSVSRTAGLPAVLPARLAVVPAAPLARVAMAPLPDPRTAPARRAMAPIPDFEPQRQPETKVAWNSEPSLVQPGSADFEAGERTFGSLLPPRMQGPSAERPVPGRRVVPVQNGLVHNAAFVPPKPSGSGSLGVVPLRSGSTRPVRLVVGASPAFSGSPIRSKPADVKPATSAMNAQPLYIQAGAFTDNGNAEHLRAKLASFGPTDVMTASVDGRVFHRVRIGPIATPNAADVTLAKLRQMGHPGARIVPR